MTTIKFDITSSRSGLFDVNFPSNVDRRLNNHVTQNQYYNIIWKINQRMKKFKSPMKNLWCSPIARTIIILVTIIICAVLIGFFLTRLLSGSSGDSYGNYLTGFVVVSIIFTTIICCATDDNCEKEVRVKKLQFDIQKIADTLANYYQIPYSKWSIKEIDYSDGESGKCFRLTAEFRLPERRVIPISMPSIRQPIDSASIQLDPLPVISAVSISGINSEQITTPLNNEQHSEYVIPPATPPPPSYHRIVHLFSQGTFTDCPNCGIQESVLDAKYCTQCGHSFLI